MKRIAPLIVLVLLVAACGDAGVGSAGQVTTLPSSDSGEPTTTVTTTAAGTTTSPEGPATTDTSAPPTSAAGPDEAPTRSTKVYFMLDSDDPFRPGPLLVPVHREIPATLAVATNSVLALFAGPTPEERAAQPAISSAIPDDAGLRGIVVVDGLATIDLTASFAAGAGSFSEFARLGQVVYTLTQFPTVEAVEILIEGQPVEFFGGHGIDVSDPQTRADYETLLPFIFVDGPAYGAEAGNPIRVTGVASVFEATFQYRLLDAAGATLDEGFVTGGSGLGFGPFDFSIAYRVDQPQTGTLVVFEFSAVDGEQINLREYAVRLNS